MTKRQLVKWLEAKQSDAKAEVEIQYATAVIFLPGSCICPPFALMRPV